MAETEARVNRLLLDDRILFPGTVLAGFARHVLSTRVRDLQVHGLVSRGYNNVALLVTQKLWTFQLSVRFRKVGEGMCIVTTMHRRVRVPGDPWGGMQDEKREFIDQDPAKRVVLKASSDAYRAYYTAALRDIWDKNQALKERRKMEDTIRAANLPETYLAVRSDGEWSCVLPTVDLSLSPEKLRLISRAA